MEYTILNIKNRRTFVIGDIHGDLEMLKTRIANDNNMRNCNLIIAGDIGLGFSPLGKHIESYNILSEFISSKGIDLYLIRGNHDDPSYFNEHKIDKDNIFTLADYTILNLGDKNILCVGGGISIDRKHRIREYEKKLNYYKYIWEGKKTEEEIIQEVSKSNYYWKDEMPIYNEDFFSKISNDNIKIDYVITHTSPNFCFKNTTKGIEYWLIMDKELDDDLTKERSVLTNIYNRLLEDGHPIKEWIYGHFHEHNEETINNIKFTTLKNSDYMWDVKEINVN